MLAVQLRENIPLFYLLPLALFWLFRALPHVLGSALLIASFAVHAVGKDM